MTEELELERSLLMVPLRFELSLISFGRMLCIAPEGFHRHHIVTKHVGLNRLETCCGCVIRAFWTGAPGRLRAMGSEIAALRKLMQESRCMIDAEQSLVSFSLPRPLATSFINLQHPSDWASSFSQITPRARNDTSARQLFHNFYISLVSREKLKIHTKWSDKRTKHSPASSYASCAEQSGEDRRSDGQPASSGRTPS